MKNTIFFLLLILFSCSQKEKTNSNIPKKIIKENGLKDNFRKIIIDYQKTYPVKNPRKNYIYIYSGQFHKEHNDTIFILTRTSAGIINETKNIYGVYEDNELKKFVFYDDSKLSVDQVKIYKKEMLDSLIWKSDVFPESITPMSKFKIVNKQLKFIQTDTIWNRWD